MEVAVRLVGRLFAEATVRRAAVVVDVAMCTNHVGKHMFVDIAGGEVRLAEI